MTVWLVPDAMAVQIPPGDVRVITWRDRRYRRTTRTRRVPGHGSVWVYQREG